MKPIERVMSVLNLEKPDRVPIGEMVIDKKVIDGFGNNYEDVLDFALGEGLDLIGAVANFRITENLPGSLYIDEWGCTYRFTKDYIDHPIKGPIINEEDLDKYEFPDPDAPNRLGDLPELVEKAQGKIAVNFHSRVAFMWSVYLMGMDNLLMTMALNPEFAHKLFTKVAETNIKVIRRAIKCGADTISLGDDYCANNGPLMSPKMFREFLLPHLKKAVEVIHEEGAMCIKHCDGNLWPILDDIVGVGIDCINPLEPVANMDMAEVKQEYGGRICIMGNIDCGELLCYGTEQEVEQAVKKCIQAGASGGGLIVSSSNSIHSGVRPQNYSAMIKAVHKYGKYPLEL